MKAIIVITGLTLFSFAITAAQLNNVEPVITDYSKVQNCRFIMKIDVYSGYGKHISEEEWRHLVIHRALLKGEQCCATHMVIDEMDPIGTFNGHLRAMLYRCPQH